MKVGSLLCLAMWLKNIGNQFGKILRDWPTRQPLYAVNYTGDWSNLENHHTDGNAAARPDLVPRSSLHSDIPWSVLHPSPRWVTSQSCWHNQAWLSHHQLPGRKLLPTATLVTLLHLAFLPRKNMCRLSFSLALRLDSGWCLLHPSSGDSDPPCQPALCLICTPDCSELSFPGQLRFSSCLLAFCFTEPHASMSIKSSLAKCTYLDTGT